MRSTDWLTLSTASRILCLGAVLVGCSSRASQTPPAQPAPASSAAATPPAAPAPSPTPRPANRPEDVRREVAGETPAPPPTGVMTMVIYFDFDQSTLRPGDRETADQVLAMLRRAPTMRVRIEGHADERGPDEYNMVLGLRRATSVWRYLEAAGIPRARLETVSFGEERPAVSGDDESAWSRNRRVEFRILTQ